MKIPQQYESFEYAGGIKWSEIFSIWKSYEAYQKDWEAHWLERGFESWDDWRNNYVAPLEPEKCLWKVYRIIKPNEDVNLIYGVPSRGWQEKCYQGEKTKMIGDILTHQTVAENKKVKSIIKNFPYQTMLTGVINEGKIVLIEGMHRALALAQIKDTEGDIVIALTQYEGDLPSIGRGNVIV
ncbi:MAG: hypothetical protein V3574_05695 [Candidatus Moraniibacteriota bacterium]